MRRASKTVIAVVFSDVHLSHRPPLARATEPDWYLAMQRPLEEIRQLQDQHKCVAICAGDVFDRPDNPAELVNWAITWFPHCHAIPGQHDLPYHNRADIHKSSYYTVVLTGIINNLDVEEPEPALPDAPNLMLWAYPWGVSPQNRLLDVHRGKMNIAVVHRYIWALAAKYPNAPADHHVARTHGLHGYRVAFFGDNHKHFHAQTGAACPVFNCGCLMRRKTDEIDLRPSVGLLHADGSVTRHILECTAADKTVRVPAKLENLTDTGQLNTGAFIEELNQLGDTELDFREAARRYLRHHEVTPAAKRVLLDAMEVKRG